VRTLGGVCAPLLAGAGGVLKIVCRIWQVGVAGWPVTGRRRGVLNITAAAWTAGFHWQRSGNITRTQNVNEYMLVLAVCLVEFCVMIFMRVALLL